MSLKNYDFSRLFPINPKINNPFYSFYLSLFQSINVNNILTSNKCCYICLYPPHYPNRPLCCFHFFVEIVYYLGVNDIIVVLFVDPYFHKLFLLQNKLIKAGVKAFTKNAQLS